MEICRICGTPLQPGKIDSITTETGEKCICIACGTQVKALIKQAEPSAAAQGAILSNAGCAPSTRRLRLISPLSAVKTKLSPAPRPLQNRLTHRLTRRKTTGAPVQSGKQAKALEASIPPSGFPP